MVVSNGGTLLRSEGAQSISLIVEYHWLANLISFRPWTFLAASGTAFYDTTWRDKYA